MKIITSLTHRAGRTVQYSPGINVEFDENCYAEVSEEDFEAIKQFDSSVKKVGSKQVYEKSDIETNDLNDGNQVNDDKLGLAKFTLKQLQEFAKESGIDESEYQNLNKKEIISFLQEKISE